MAGLAKSMKRRRITGAKRRYGKAGWASDAALASAGGYRNWMGNPYTVDVLLRKTGSNGFVDKYYNHGMAYDYATPVALLATIAQGTTTQERIGRKCQLTSIQLRGEIRASSIATATVAHAVLTIVYDKRPNGVLPTLSEIYEGTNPEALNNENGFDRFQILKRWDLSVIGNLAAAGNQTAKSQYIVKKYIKLKNKPACYKTDAPGVAGTITGITEGALYTAISCDHTVASTLAPHIQVSTRVRFRDQLS